MIEKLIQLSSGAKGILTLPTNTKLLYPAILTLHGFGSNKNGFNNAFSKLASEFSKKAITLQIDFRGFGETKMPTEKITIDTMLDDFHQSMEFLNGISMVSKIGVLGVSLGTAITSIGMLNKTSLGYCDSIAMVSPACNLLDDFNKFLGNSNMQLLKQCGATIELDLGWRKILLGRDFYTSLQTYSFSALKGIKQYPGSLLCVAGANDFSCLNAKKYHKECISDDKTLNIIDDADHVLNKNKSNIFVKTIIDVGDWTINQLTKNENKNNLNFN